MWAEALSAMGGTYALSDNPPAPRPTLFRHGDWICLCAAHNFGRNTNCIACGTMKDHVFYSSAPQTLALPQRPPSLPPKPSHPLLTPSGRAFAVGGRVQNVSSDPLNPCIMYWPDNEPFPEQSQIRPSNVVGVAPPILNTGNRGPISHQPGDWICGKCNYLNWRRRKVCQTCLPYAEGNGDSISAAVQAERIALLTQVLTQASQGPASSPSSHLPPASAHLSPSSHMPSTSHIPSPSHSPLNAQPPHSHSPMGLTPPLGMSMGLGTRTNTLTPPQVRSRVPSSAHPPPFHPQSSSSLSHANLGSVSSGPSSFMASNSNSNATPSSHQGHGHIGGRLANNSPFTTSVPATAASGTQHGLGFPGNHGASNMHTDATAVHEHQRGQYGGAQGHGGDIRGGGDMRQGVSVAYDQRGGHGRDQARMGRSRSYVSLRGASPQIHGGLGVGMGGGRMSPMIYQTGHTAGSASSTPLSASLALPPSSSLGFGLGSGGGHQGGLGQGGQRSGRAATLNLGHGHGQGTGMGLQSSMHAPVQQLSQSAFSNMNQLNVHGNQQHQNQHHQLPPHFQTQQLQHERERAQAQGLQSSMHAPSHPALGSHSLLHTSFGSDVSLHPSLQHPSLQRQLPPHQLQRGVQQPRRQTVPSSLHPSLISQSHDLEQHEQQLYATGPLPGAFSHPPSVASSVAGGTSKSGSPEPGHSASLGGSFAQSQSGRRQCGDGEHCDGESAEERAGKGKAFPVLDDRDVVNLAMALRDLPLRDRLPRLAPAQPSQPPRQEDAQMLYSTATPREHPEVTYRSSNAEGPQSRVHAPAPAALLPAFLQDLIHAQSQSQARAQVQSHSSHSQNYSEEDARAQYAGMGYAGMRAGMVQSPPSLSPASAGSRSVSASETSSELHEHVYPPLTPGTATALSAPPHAQSFEARRPRVSSGSTDSEGSRVGGGGSIWSPGFVHEKNGVSTPLFANGASTPFRETFNSNGNGSGSGSERSSPGYRNGANGMGMFGATPFAATPTAFGHGHGVGVIGMGRAR